MCVVREREEEGKEGGAGTSGLEPNASTARSCPHSVWTYERGGVCYGSRSMLWDGFYYYISIKSEAELSPLYVPSLLC